MASKEYATVRVRSDVKARIEHLQRVLVERRFAGMPPALLAALGAADPSVSQGTVVAAGLQALSIALGLEEIAPHGPGEDPTVSLERGAER